MTNRNFSSIQKEAVSLIKLATPLIAALVLSCLMTVIDTIMAGQVSALDLAAVSIGAAVWNLIFLTMTATLMALSAQIAALYGKKQEHGEQQPHAISDWIANARWYALFLAGIFYLIGQLGLALIKQLDTHPDTNLLAQNYLQFILLGLPAAALFQIHKSLSEGLGITQHVLTITAIAVALNIPLNYLFIYGFTVGQYNLIPALGGAGCGLASGIIFWLSLLGLIAIQKTDKRFIQRYLGKSSPVKNGKEALTIRFSWRFTPQFLTVSKHLTKVGIPIGLAILAEASVFTYIPLVIAHLGEIQVAAHQITLNVTSVMFMVPLGLSHAITVRTGFHLGRSSNEQAKLVTRTGIALAFCFGFISMSLIVANNEFIPSLYSKDQNVLALASSLLILAAIFQLSDAVQIAASGSLRGYQMTTIPMILTVIAFWGIAIPVGYILGLESDIRTFLEDFLALPEPSGAKGFWIALISGLTANACLQITYLFYIQRNKEYTLNSDK